MDGLGSQNEKFVLTMGVQWQPVEICEEQWYVVKETRVVS